MWRTIALQLAYHSTCISAVGVRRFLSCLGIPTPATSSLQRSVNQFGPKMEDINKKDMLEKRKLVKDVLEHRGLPRDSPIAAEYDRQYNNTLRNAPKNTPFAPATQSRDVLVENATKEKFIIGYHHTNKLCTTRRNNKELQCPNHKGCTATVGPGYNISNEKDGRTTLAEQLLSSDSPLKVSHL